MFTVLSGLMGFVLNAAFDVFKQDVKPSAAQTHHAEYAKYKGLTFVTSSKEVADSIVESGVIPASFEITNPLKKSVKFVCGPLAKHVTRFYMFKKSLPNKLYIIRVRVTPDMMDKLKHSTLTDLFYIEGDVHVENVSVQEISSKKVAGYKGINIFKNMLTALHVACVQKNVKDFVKLVLTIWLATNIVPELSEIPQLDVVMPYILKYFGVKFI